MKYRYQCTFEEFDEAVRAVRRWYYRITAAGAVLVGLLTLAYSGYSIICYPAGMAGYLVLAAGGFTVFMLTRGQSRLIRRAWQSRPALRETQSVEFSGDGLLIRAGGAEKAVPWQAVSGIRETPRLFIVSFHDGSMTLLPKRALGGAGGVEKVRKLLTR